MKGSTCIYIENEHLLSVANNLWPVVQSVASLNYCRSRSPDFDLARPHTFLEIYHEIFSKVIFLFPLLQGGLLSVTHYCKLENFREGFILAKLGICEAS